MKAIKILVVEDEELIAELIKDYLIGFGFTQVFLAYSKNMAEQALEHISPDLVLLDLHLQGPRDGLEIAAQIDQKQGPPYIFITANANLQVVQQATQTTTSGYITKPIKKADLFAAVQLALKAKLKPEEAYLLVKESNQTFRIKVDDILYIESNSNYIYIFTKTKKITTRNSLEWIETQLSKSWFLRIHRSFIVNLNAIESINPKSVFINNTEISISRANTSRLSEYIARR